MASEKTPLVSSSPTPTAYFLDGVHKRKPSSAGEVSFDTTFSRAEGEEVGDTRENVERRRWVDDIAFE